MREILFRAKRLDNGEWVMGDLVHSYFKVGDTCINENAENLGFHQIWPDTVGQYTGLLDKNGKKIFEGDIVLDRWNEPKAVLFCTEDVASCGCCHPLFEGSGFKAEYALLADTCVIGNMHDNPELLKGMEHGKE